MGWLLPSIFPFSWYWGGGTRAVLGTVGDTGHPRRATSTGGLSPPLHAQPLSPPGFFGVPKGVTVTLLWQSALGITGSNPALSNSLGSSHRKLLQFPCPAGKDDCSKPKLGINYTTTLHFFFFFYKGEKKPKKTVCGKSCADNQPPSRRSSLRRGLLWKA